LYLYSTYLPSFPTRLSSDLVSSLGGYQIVNDMVAYCASKFYVSAFTEGLAHELQERGALLKAKVLAPAVTKTNFDAVARNTKDRSEEHTSELQSRFELVCRL